MRAANLQFPTCAEEWGTLHEGRTPTLTVLHAYNVSATNMVQFYRELKQVFDDAGLPNVAGSMVGTYSAISLPPPLAVDFAADSEDRAKQLLVALKPYLTTDAMMRAKPRLRAGTVEISVYGRPDFLPDGSVVLR